MHINLICLIIYEFIISCKNINILKIFYRYELLKALFHHEILIFN